MLTVKKGDVFSSEKLCFFQHFGILCFLHPLVLLTQLFHISPRTSLLLRTTAGIVIGHVRSGKPRERRMRWRQFPISFLGIARTGSVPVLVMRVVPAWTTRARQTRVFQEVDLAFGLGMGIAGMTFEQWVIVEAFRTFVVFVRKVTKASGGMMRLHWYFFFARCDAPRNFDAAIIFLIETFAGMLRSLDSERLWWKVCLLSSFGLWLVLSLLCSSTLNSALPGLGLEVWGTVAWQPWSEKLSEETERWNLVCRFSLDFEESSTSSWWRASGVAVWGQTWERIESNLVPTLQIDLSRL